jgi:hypothetical protein
MALTRANERDSGPGARDLLRRLREDPRWRVARDIFYGIFFYDTVLMFRRQRGELESLFVLILFGDMLGVPILPPYYSLRLLPFVVPSVQNWRNRLLRERDLTDLIG